MRYFFVVTATIASLGIHLGFLITSPSALAQDQETQRTVVKILRGKTVCTDTSKNDAICGTEHWSVYVHSDGSRAMHVASETSRNGEVRHAMIVVDPNGTPTEAFMHNRGRTGAIGSTFVDLKPEGVDAAIKNTSFDDIGNVTVKNIEATSTPNSVSAGPASADGLHFLKYDFDGGTEQPRNVYWMGGSRMGSMAGSFRPTTHTYLGEAEISLPNEDRITVDHFSMASGTEVWLTKEDRVVVRMDVKFGNISGTRYRLTEFEAFETRP